MDTTQAPADAQFRAEQARDEDLRRAQVQEEAARLEGENWKQKDRVLVRISGLVGFGEILLDDREAEVILVGSKDPTHDSEWRDIPEHLSRGTNKFLFRVGNNDGRSLRGHVEVKLNDETLLSRNISRNRIFRVEEESLLDFPR